MFYLHFLLLLNLDYILVTIRFRLIDNTSKHLLPMFTSTLMTLYQNYTKLKLRSVYEKSLQHLACPAVFVKNFWVCFHSKKYFWFTIDCIYAKRNQTTVEVSGDLNMWLPSRQILVPRSSRGRPPPTSPKDPIWPSRRCSNLTSRGRLNLTSWGRHEMRSRGRLNLMFKGRPLEDLESTQTWIFLNFSFRTSSIDQI